MSDEQPTIPDDEAPPIAPDAQEQRPVLPAGDYQGTLQRWKQAAFTYSTQKGGEETARYDDISVKVVHPELGICFAQTSAFDNKYNTNFAPKSNSSAERFRKAFGVTGYTNAQLAELVGDGTLPVRVKVVNSQRKDRKNLDENGKPTTVVEALIAGIWREPAQE